MADAKKLPVTFVVGAIDNATYKVLAINEKFKRITKPVSQVGQALSTLAQESGLAKAATRLGQVGSAGARLGSELAGVAARIGATAAAATAAVYGLVHSFANAGDDVKTVAQRLGLTTDAYQELAYAANQAQVPQDQFNAAMEKFTRNAGAAAAGTGEGLVAFNALGISLRDSHGRLRTLDSLLPEVADKLGKIRNQNVRNALAAKFFGREGAKLNEIFSEGSKGLEELRKQAREVGAVMTPEQIEAASKFDNGMKSVMATLLMVRNVIGAALAPVLVDLGMKLQRYILDHQEDIRRFAAAFAEKLPGVLSDLAGKFSMIGSVLETLASIFSAVSSVIGPVNTALLVMAGYFGGTGLISAVFGFTKSLVLLLPTLVQIGTVIFGLIGWIPLLIAGLIGAAVMIYRHWKPISEFFVGIFDRVKGFFGFGGKAVEANLNSKTENFSRLIGPSSSRYSLGPAVGGGETISNAAAAQGQRSETRVKVDFSNAPRGTRVSSEKSDADWLDLSMGYSYAGAGG